MTQSQSRRSAAEERAGELTGPDLTAQIDDTIDAVGQPGADSAEFRHIANARLAKVVGEW